MPGPQSANEQTSLNGAAEPWSAAEASAGEWKEICDRDLSQAKRLYGEIVAGSAKLLCQTNLIYRYQVNIPAVEMLQRVISGDAGIEGRHSGSLIGVTVENFIPFVQRTKWRDGSAWNTPNQLRGYDGTLPYSGITDEEWGRLCREVSTSPVEQFAAPKSLIGSISWYDAAAFCLHAEAQVRLPTIKELRELLGGRFAETHWFWSCEWFDRDKAHMCVARRGRHGIETLGLNPDLRNRELGLAVIRGRSQKNG